MFKNLIVLGLLISSLPCFSQSATGSWYGRADVNLPTNASNYLTELIIKQKGDEVEGIFGYYFKDSYESFFIRGKYNPRTRVVEIKNIPILFYGADTRDGIECPMHFTGILVASQLTSTLKGSFHTDNKYRYTCPELTVHYTIDKDADQDSIIERGVVAERQFWKPIAADYIVSNRRAGDSVVSRTDNRPVVESGAVAQHINPRKEQDLVAKFSARKNMYSKDIEIDADSIRVSFYDNGEIDGDTISVFLNGKPIVSGQGLSARAFNIYIALDNTKEVNELSMFAENMGLYPPNTALMVITDGINRHELYLSSSLTQNATIRLVRKKPGKN